MQEYAKLTSLEPEKAAQGRGHRKSPALRLYDNLAEHIKRLKNYANYMEICGEKCGGYSKTGKDATFMRIKRDYMGNGQLLPAYNVQLGTCDKYIAVYDVKQYASDMDCFPDLRIHSKITFMNRTLNPLRCQCFQGNTHEGYF